MPDPASILVRQANRLSCLLLAVLSLSPTPAEAAGKYSLKEILQKISIRRIESPYPTLIQMSRVTLGTGENGWSGGLSDRWHSSDAFRDDFRSEFLAGLEHFLTESGFQVGTGPEAVLVKVTINHFEGRKRIHDDGGDLRGTLTLNRDGQVLKEVPLSETLSYQDESDECPAFEKHFGLDGIEFPTVLFFRLALGFYDSIGAALQEIRPLLTSDAPAMAVQVPPLGPSLEAPAAQSAGVGSAKLAAGPVGFLSIESFPDSAEVYLDDRMIATTPVKDAPLPAGAHRLIIRKPGYRDWVRELTVLTASQLTLIATLDKAGP